MKARKRAVWVGLVVALFFGILPGRYLLRDSADIRCAGKRLSYHLLNGWSARRIEKPPHVPDAALMASTSASRQAVLNLGTNCLPLLRRWLATETAPWKTRAGLRLSGRNILYSMLPPEDLRLVACRTAAELNAAAVPLAPQLAAACTNSNAEFADTALRTLAVLFQQMETPPPPMDVPLQPTLDNSIRVIELRALHDSTWKYRLEMLRKVRQRADFTLGVKDLPLAEQAKALRVLSRRNELFAPSYPLLLIHLESTNVEMAENAAICLRNYGARASNALPYLEKELAHPNERVRAESAKAIERISALMKEKSSQLH